MTIVSEQWWLRFSERAFSFNFIAFSFVMFSCWFPTGFSATLSTFAFLFALPLFFYRFTSIKLSLFEKAGLLVFLWLLLTVAWSEVFVTDSLRYLSEYRLYFMLPVFTAALAVNKKTRRRAFHAAMSGAFIALITSYGLGFGWWQIEGATFSLANRIFHGFIMSSFLLVCLLVTRDGVSWWRYIAAVAGLFTIYNVLNIETGRTAYIQIVCICFVFAAVTFSRVKLVLMLTVLFLAITVSYLTFDKFQSRVIQTITNVENMIINDDYQSSAGQRLEYYRGAMDIGMDYPLTGVGVGDVVGVLQARAESGAIRVLTDNVHSEFLNMLIIGGFPAFLLFFGFVWSIIYAGISIRANSKPVGDALIGLGLLLFISCLFNSTIKDYGEKQALLIMLSIIGAALQAAGAVKTNSNLKSG